MEASFNSPAINDSTRRLFGMRAISSGKSMEEFDVSSTMSKAQQDLSGILILGSIAGKALQEYWNVNRHLPSAGEMIKVDARLADLRKHGFAFEGITGADILQARNTVGIDIGEGTVNFPVFQDGRFNADASGTFAKGYGTVLEQARERLVAANMPFGSRKALAEFLNQAPSPLQQARYNRVRKVVDDEILGFVTEVLNEFHKIMSRAGAYVEVLYIYGGGATPVKGQFYDPLLEAVKGLGGEDVMFPVLYLDSRYSRFLNREGLYVIAKNLADRV